jgi:hypothetical protein
VAAAKPLVALVAFFLLTASAAFADAPTVRVTQADQQRAVAALITLKDLSSGWQGGRVKTQPLSAPQCPGFNPKESDLVVSGHADAAFQFQGAALYQDVQVLRSADAVATDFHRTISPKLGDCLAYELRHQKGVAQATVTRLDLPKVGDVSAAYRASLVLKDGTRTLRLSEDFVFFGVGRYEYALRVLVPQSAKTQLVPFESTMANMLVKRAAKPCC